MNGTDNAKGNPSWNQSPSEFDKSIVKRQSPQLCGEPSGNRADYDLELHIGSVFVVLFVSASACAFPLIATKVPRLRVPKRFLFFIRHFGTGVLLATAFAHLFPTAFQSLLDPCLGDFFTVDYPALPGVIALAAVFVVTVIEQVFSPGRHCMTVTASETNTAVSMDEMRTPPPPQERSTAAPLYGRKKLGRTDSTGQHLARMTSQSAEHDRIERGNPESSHPEDDAIAKDPKIASDEEPEQPTKLTDPELAGSEPEATPDQKRQKLLLQCILLEVGILFHSVFIGMALAVATGSDFIVLLLAIVFHQTFEGVSNSAIKPVTYWHGPFIVLVLSELC